MDLETELEMYKAIFCSNRDKSKIETAKRIIKFPECSIQKLFYSRAAERKAYRLQRKLVEAGVIIRPKIMNKLKKENEK